MATLNISTAFIFSGMGHVEISPSLIIHAFNKYFRIKSIQVSCVIPNLVGRRDISQTNNYDVTNIYKGNDV